MSARQDQPQDVPDDGEYGAPIDNGVQAHNMGSFLSEASYRPVPIVWLGGAWFAQVAVLLVLFFLLLGKAPWFTIATTSLATLGIVRWTWRRGMAQAGSGWKGLTLIALGCNLALVVLARLGA